MYSFASRVCPPSQRAAVKAFPTTSSRGRVPSRPKLPAVSRASPRSSRSFGPCRAESKSTGGKDPALAEFSKLLDANAPRSTEWLQDLQRRGRDLAAHVESLRTCLAQKAREMQTVQSRLTETTAVLEEAKKLQLRTAAQLEVRTNEVELLKKELNRLEHDRDADVTASMERYRELEDALAHVEAELRSQSETLQAREPSSPADAAKLGEIVQEQDAVFQKLQTTLRQATEEKMQAENAAVEAKLRAEEMERLQVQLQQDQELLSKELSQLQILYAQKELEWTNDVQNVRQDCAKLKEASVGMEMTLTTKDRKLQSVSGAFEQMKSNFAEMEVRLRELKRECAELKSVNNALEEAVKKTTETADQQLVTHLRSQLTRLQVRAPVLEAEIEEMTEQRKLAEQKYTSLERDCVRHERKCAQLEQRAAILQSSVEDKSNRLVAAQKEKRTLKSEADRMGRESAALRRRLERAEKDFEAFKGRLIEGEEERRELQRSYHQEILSIAERQQEAQRAIVYHQEHKNENRDLTAKIRDLTQQLEQRKSEIQQLLQNKEAEMEQLKAELEAAEALVKSRDVDLVAAADEYQELETKLASLKASSETSLTQSADEIRELKQKLQQSGSSTHAAQAEVQNLKKELVKFQNELGQRQRIISARDQEILTLKDDTRLANERVDALRGQITSMQTLNREMEVEMSETDNVMSQMNQQLREMKAEGEEKQRSIDSLTKSVSELEAKGKQSMVQFSTQIESLEEYSKQQEALVESFFEEKQSLEETVSDLEAQLKEETEKGATTQEELSELRAAYSDVTAKLDQTQKENSAVRESAAAELEEAAAILAKAESMAHSVQGSLEEEPVELNGAASREGALLGRIDALEGELQEERKAMTDSAALAEKLQAEVLSLQQRLANLQEMEKDVAVQQLQTGTATEDEAISMNQRLSKSLAAEQAAVCEIHRLREQMKEMERSIAPSPDEGVNALRRRAQALETENEKLRKAAMKRNQILAQSRHFIEQYLDRSVNSLTDLQP